MEQTLRFHTFIFTNFITNDDFLLFFIEIYTCFIFHQYFD